MAEVDYKALCEEIFGTADAGKIRALATQLSLIHISEPTRPY